LITTVLKHGIGFTDVDQLKAPVLVGVETFNKPDRVGFGEPYHQDKAYFCQTTQAN
jgi:hypothetical protein